MKMIELIGRLTRHTPTRSRTAPATRDWSSDWTPRDWADLPTYHPRRDSDAN